MKNFLYHNITERDCNSQVENDLMNFFFFIFEFRKMAEKPEEQFNIEDKIQKGKELYARGCRNYYVKRYSEAADDLSDACKFYGEAYGVDGDECGDALLLYAKALVALGQEENKLIEVPENEEEDEPAEEDDGEGEGEGEGEEEENEGELKIY